MVEGEPECVGEMERQYKLEGQSGRRRGIVGVPGELSERTAQRGVGWMSRRWESVEDIEALWPPCCCWVAACSSLKIQPCQFPMLTSPAASLSSMTTEGLAGSKSSDGSWFWLQPYYRLTPFIPLLTNSIQLSYIYIYICTQYIYIYTHISLYIKYYIWTGSSLDNCGSSWYFSDNLKKQIKTVHRILAHVYLVVWN